jgi:hypothetical protein
VEVNIWFIVWLLLSGSLVFFAGWTVYILYMQKKSWRDFAKKNQLRFTSGRYFSSPEINGTVDGYTIGVFSSEHISQDVRGSRRLTAIEVGLQSRLPFAGSVGSGGMVGLVQRQSYSDEVRPDHKSWSTAYVARAASGQALESYLNPARIEALTSLMKMKNAWVIFIFQTKDTLLRIDTPDPLDKPEKIEKAVRKMIEVAKALELESGEKEILEKTATEARRKPKTKALDAKDIEVSPPTFELEEDSGT